MSEILKEKNLREIYKKSKIIPISNFNKFFSIFLGAISFCILFVSNFDTESSYNKINDLSTFLFSPIFATLGFLVAGYTIFCTITPLDLQRKMIQHKDQKTNLMFFKKIHFTFIRVFIYFLIFSFLLFIIYFLKDFNLSFINYLLPDDYTKLVYKYTNYFILSVLVSGTSFLFCELGSFIFNIYNSVVTTLHWSIHNEEK